MKASEAGGGPSRRWTKQEVDQGGHRRTQAAEAKERQWRRGGDGRAEAAAAAAAAMRETEAARKWSWARKLKHRRASRVVGGGHMDTGMSGQLQGLCARDLRTQGALAERARTEESARERKARERGVVMRAGDDA